MRIAVTGAAGYIGGWLCRELKARGHEVHAQDRRPPGGMRDRDSWQGFDLGDDRSRAGWLQAVKPDTVVHLAAVYGRIWGEADLAETARVNAGLTAALARDCAKAGARLCLVSSSEVYGSSAAAGGLVTEDAPLAPLNMYGLSKKWAEEAARLYAPDGLAVCRLNMPYGPPACDPEPGTAPENSGRAAPLGFNMLHTFLWQASHGMPITAHQGAERCMTWIGDTVRGVTMIIESGQPGTWNVNRDDDYAPVRELAILAVLLSERSPASVIYEAALPSGVTPRKRLAAARLLALGWKPEVDLEDGMSRSMIHFSRYDRDGKWRG